MPADLILYALVAAGLVMWLRTILGTRHGDERQRPNPFTTTPETEKKPAGFTPQADEITLPLGEFEQKDSLPRNVSIDSRAEEGLVQIGRTDRYFDTAHFVSGAESAFILIVDAFAKGDRETLRGLLSPAVYGAFEGVIARREADGETVETEIHAVRKLDIQEAFLRDRTAYITVQFTADETCIIRDKEGDILSGDPDRITEMCDIWVFSRDIKSKDPTWQVAATRDGEPEDHKTPLPEAS